MAENAIPTAQVGGGFSKQMGVVAEQSQFLSAPERVSQACEAGPLNAANPHK
jgi:hypothetical protein